MAGTDHTASATQHSANSISPIEPIAVRIPDAQRISGFSRSEIYRRAGRGDIVLLKCGASTLVDFASLKAAVAALPRAGIRAPRAG